jgi:hypothetical protein
LGFRELGFEGLEVLGFGGLGLPLACGAVQRGPCCPKRLITSSPVIRVRPESQQNAYHLTAVALDRLVKRLIKGFGILGFGACGRLVNGIGV